MIDFSSKPLFLAPLAGYTDPPFRSVVKRFGVDVTVSEMISSNALVYTNEKTLKMLQKSPLETPYSVQIAGDDVGVIQKAVHILNEYNGIDIIDLNAGCPAKKVVGNNQGSALLKDLKKLQEIIKTIKKTSDKPMTSVKVRLGWSTNNIVDIVKAIEDAGADFITIHGRTRSQLFGGYVNYEAIAEAKISTKIPIVANGDIDSYAKAKAVFEATGCDGIMIGRASIGNPWIFYQIKHSIKEPSLALKKEVVLEHLDRVCEFYGDRGIAIFRKHLHTYSKGLRGATSFREKVNTTKEKEQLVELIEEYFA
ncbi:MAG: tRNA dihydrouridine synthase DusB [Campylobacterales bacterium]